jgi:hypothetical protein
MIEPWHALDGRSHDPTRLDKLLRLSTTIWNNEHQAKAAREISHVRRPRKRRGRPDGGLHGRGKRFGFTLQQLKLQDIAGFVLRDRC